jgi:hypothetical protein
MQSNVMKTDNPKGLQIIFGENRAAEANAIAHSVRAANIQISPLDAILADDPNQLDLFVGMKLPN